MLMKMEYDKKNSEKSVFSKEILKILSVFNMINI